MSYQYLPGFEPDFDVKQELRFIGGMPDLHQFDYVYISCSGGKDSHAMAYILSELATMQNYDKNKMELIYADTGLEWHDTFEQVKRIGNAVNIKAVKVLPKYKLLDNVRRRWAKFNGLPDDWQNGNEGVGRQTDRQTDSTPAGKTEVWHPHSRTSPSGSATAITSEIRSSSMSVSEPRSYVLPQLGKDISSGAVYQSKVRGGGRDSWNRPFPSQFAKFCTAWGKQAPIEQYTRQSVPLQSSEILHWRKQEQCNSRESTAREQSGGRLGSIRILMCSGERREESSKRATYPEWSIHEALTTKKRRTYRWRPMLDYKVADVWSMVKDSGIEAHEAYQLGCDRLGCTMCIFAGECGRMAKDVKIACRENPEQYEELDKLEMDTGFTMSIQGVRIRDIVKKA